MSAPPRKMRAFPKVIAAIAAAALALVVAARRHHGARRAWTPRARPRGRP